MQAWTYNRRPVELMWSQTFPRIRVAIAIEQQMKKWSGAKKEAVIRGDWSARTFFPPVGPPIFPHPHHPTL